MHSSAPLPPHRWMVDLKRGHRMLIREAMPAQDAMDCRTWHQGELPSTRDSWQSHNVVLQYSTEFCCSYVIWTTVLEDAEGFLQGIMEGVSLMQALEAALCFIFYIAGVG